MKKSILIVLVLLLLLTACQVVPDDDQSLASTPSSSSSITPPPSSSVVPTTQPTTTPTIANTTDYNGFTWIYVVDSWMDERYDFSECIVGHLYWVLSSTKECVVVCDEPTVSAIADGTNIYFVKESEPTKIYSTPIGDFEKHELIYESMYGDISSLGYNSVLKSQLDFVAGGNKFVVWDMTTGESTVLMEQYHINSALLFINDDGTWTEIIHFEGQHTENDWLYTQYVYNWVTGELKLGDDDCV